MRRLRVALGCLTIVPVKLRGDARETDLGGSLLWFPLVGLLIGLVLAGTHAAASQFLPPLAAAACVLLAWVLVTGALHLDGFGDVCDGLYAGRTPAERLRIMKDPQIGAMAAVGLGTLLLMKFALLCSLPPAAMPSTLLLSPCLGRYAMVLMGTTLPYARPEGGTASAFVRFAPPGALAWTTAFVLPVSWLAFGWVGLALLGASMAAGLALRSVFRRTLGGITGDALGATGELTELVVLFGACLAAG